MRKLLHNMVKLLHNIYMYVYICLVAGINQRCFQKLKSSNVFYARAQQMMQVAKRLVINTIKQ